MENLFVESLTARQSARTFFEEAANTYTRQQMTNLINPIINTTTDFGADDEEERIIKY
jgi:hypothetical protein